MNEKVSVDASLIVALLVPERYTTAALALWERWINQDIHIVAPALLGYEVTSALYRKVLQKIFAFEDGRAALLHFLALDIAMLHIPELHILASDLAKKFDRPNTYDAHYLALASHEACPLWTADMRLYNTVRGKFESIYWVEEI